MRVERSVSGFPGTVNSIKKDSTSFDGVSVYWDPIIKSSFKRGISLALEGAITSYQAATTLDLVGQKLKRLSTNSEFDLNNDLIISINQFETAEKDQALHALNSVQHNVPAWAIFGIFFIVVPLGANVIKEREQKTLTRLHLIEGGVTIAFAGKVLTYLMVAASQFVLILLAGLYLLPALGLPALYIGNSYGAIVFTVIALGLAASSYGIFLGTVFSNHHQASTFGSVSIVILAAIGGIWVPVFVMPEVIQLLSNFSPLSWGMNAFNSIFLRGTSLSRLWPELFPLFTFSGLMFILSFSLEKIRKGN